MTDARPVYQRIADDLRRRIDDGTLPVGSRIPSRSELRRAYDASDQTVDRAVRVLKAAGYAHGQFGRGVFVSDRVPIGALVRAPHSVDTPLAARLVLACGVSDTGDDALQPPTGGPSGPPEATPHLAWEATSTTGNAPPLVAERLALGAGAPVVRTAYEFLADRRPLQLSVSWEPLALTGGTEVELPDRGPYARCGVPGRFAAIGIRVVRAREAVGSRPASPTEAEALGCSPGQSLTVVERTHYDDHRRPVETSDTVVRGDRWRLEYPIDLAAPHPAVAR
ncbi:GntR family transcriptional regulator [Streptomyces spiramenti]|uniref:GntR family transcriptional regulator n=1 Tax=Streptomyces spiramenti TaxID=2720606 RepID=A0ABX1AE12_9ACTN|nr:GntR family transcriptional regulator [Streptomyces spiramenti]NJP65408.1 GntR family transcriptional regulator [Streptomyces spiramenti]